MSLPDISPLMYPDSSGSSGLSGNACDPQHAGTGVTSSGQFSCNKATGTWYANNAANRITIIYTQNGTAEFSDSENAFGLTLSGLGRVGNITPAGKGTIRASGRQLDIARPGYTEWYRNNEEGVEQGVTIMSREPGSGLLQVRFGLTGDAALFREDNRTLTITSASKTPLFVYTGLHAFSADGRELPSSFAADGTTVTWVVDDTGAAYPVTIDPAVISASAPTARFAGGADSDFFGWSASLASDGSRALVGAYGNNSNTGAAYIFDKPAGGWSGTTSASAATATFTGGATGDCFGKSVALSSDGTRALIGAYCNDSAASEAGAAYIFVKPQGGWTGTTSASAANARFTGGAANDNFGNAVSLSSNGNRAIIGAYHNTTGGANAGAAYIFEAPGGVWSGTTSASAANARFIGGAANDNFSYSVSLSSDGNRALVGALENDSAGNNAGAAYIFEAPGGIWSGTTSASAATANFTGGAASDNFGYSVSLSPDGSRVLIGAPSNGTAYLNAGAAYIFDKPGGGWGGTKPASAANALLTGAAVGDFFGGSVSLSSDGSRALVGAYNNDTAGSGAGAAYIFDKPSVGWSGTTSASAATATFTGGAASDNFGYSVSLSSDGSRALAGAPINATSPGTNTGAAYLFQSPFAVFTAGGTVTGRTGTVANGLTLTPTGTLTNVDLYLGTDASTPSGTAIKTGISSLPASVATAVDGMDLTGKAAGTYYILAKGSGTTSILGATGSAVYTVSPAPSFSSSGDTGPAPAQSQQVSTISVNVGQIGRTPITNVDVTGIKVQDIIVTAAEVKGPGTNIAPAPGTIYEYVDIFPARYTEITVSKISFVVPQSWLDANHLTPKDVVLYHNSGKNWVALPTTLETIKDKQAYYSAIGTSFSRFAICGQFNSSAQDPAHSGSVQTSGDMDQASISATPMFATPTVNPAPVITRTTAIPAPQPAPGLPVTTLAIIGAAGILLIGGAIIFRRWWIRRQNPALFKEYR